MHHTNKAERERNHNEWNWKKTTTQLESAVCAIWVLFPLLCVVFYVVYIASEMDHNTRLTHTYNNQPQYASTNFASTSAIHTPRHWIKYELFCCHIQINAKIWIQRQLWKRFNARILLNVECHHQKYLLAVRKCECVWHFYFHLCYFCCW